MQIFQNQYLIENISRLLSAGAIAFIIAFLFTPIAGKIAHKVGAIDIPAALRNKSERGYATRLHKEPVPRLGGLAMVVAIILVLLLTNSFIYIPKGILIGAIIIIILGFLEDTLELDGKVQIFFQFAAAAIVVITGTSITNIHFLGNQINFNLFSAAIEFLGYTYNFIFPADILTILWIVGLMNVVNWVDGMDGLNGSIVSIATLTLLLFAVANGNIPLAIIIAIHLGSILGVLPYNYPPAKIYYGMGAYVNGYLLAIFAIIGSTRWTATLILLGMPIIDGLLVLFMRFRAHPELLKHPWKILSVSDINHLHHRLLASGYSKKIVLLIEVAIMATLCSIAIYFSDIRTDVVAFIVGFSTLFVIFTIVFFLKKRNERNKKLVSIGKDEEKPVKEGIVTVVYDSDREKEKEEKFIY